MKLLDDTRVSQSIVHALREVRVGIPLERRPQVRDFYTRVIGLPEWPAEQCVPGGWCAGRPRRGIYFVYRHDAEVDAVRRRITILVPSLDMIEQKLREIEWGFQRLRGLSYCEQRILVSDPIGHLVELRQCQPL